MRPREHQHSVTNDWRIWGSIIIFLSVLVVANIAFNKVVAIGAGRDVSISENLDMYLRIWLGRVSVVPIVWWFASLAKFGSPWPRVIGMQILGMATAIGVHTIIVTPGVESLTDYLSWQAIDQTRNADSTVASAGQLQGMPPTNPRWRLQSDRTNIAAW